MLRSPHLDNIVSWPPSLVFGLLAVKFQNTVGVALLWTNKNIQYLHLVCLCWWVYGTVTREDNTHMSSYTWGLFRAPNVHRHRHVRR